mgnify:CR=1 FL=1
MWLDRCASTNDEARARLGDPRVLAVGADVQTAGRGRRGRAWSSPPGCGLYLSWIARPGFAQALGGAVPLLAAVALAEWCAAAGHPPVLKWPNDLLLGGRKLAGILCEAQGTPDSWTAVVGLGLNLRTPPGGWPPAMPAAALDGPFAARDVATALLPGLQAWLDRVAKSGLAPVIDAWERFAPPPGTRLRQGDVEGDYAGLAPDGALRLLTSAGERLVHAGQVDLVAWQRKG